MLQRIMVPLDGSTFAEAALSTAFHIARKQGSSVHLVRVHEPPIQVAGTDGAGTYDPALDKEVERKGRQYLGVMQGWTNGDDSVRAVMAYLHGSVIECLSNYVRDKAIDLVVMTTHARGGVSRALLGSVADGLVRQSPAPVLLIRSGNDADPVRSTPLTFRRVLLPVDGGPAGNRMIEHAVAVTGEPGVEYTLIRVVTKGGGTLRATLPRRGENPGSRVQRATVEEALGTTARALTERGFGARPKVVVDDDAGDAILHYAAAHDFDLIAMATRSRGGLERLFLGSVADRVLRDGQTTLLLWNPGPPTTPSLVEAFSLLGTR